jgi:hypothetical protein
MRLLTQSLGFWGPVIVSIDLKKFKNFKAEYSRETVTGLLGNLLPILKNNINLVLFDKRERGAPAAKAELIFEK